MVWFFECVNPNYVIYMGVDKHENELLLKFAWAEDIWFHVDSHSSAHVYLRCKPLKDGTPNPEFTLDSIPEDVLDECCQLVKANSIEGNKLNNVQIVYTPVPNLKKTGDMAIGQVGFRKGRVLFRMVEKRINAVVNRISKTKTDVNETTFKDQHSQRARAILAVEKAKKKQTERARLEEITQSKKDKEEREFRDVMTDEKMVSNKEIEISAEEFEDDFL